MQYSLTCHQFIAYELGLNKQLDATDLLLFDFICNNISNPSVQGTVIDGTVFWKISVSFVKKECPILRINNRAIFLNRMEKLCSAGLLSRYKNTDFYCFDDKAEAYYSVTI